MVLWVNLYDFNFIAQEAFVSSKINVSMSADKNIWTT